MKRVRGWGRGQYPIPEDTGGVLAYDPQEGRAATNDQISARTIFLALSAPVPAMYMERMVNAVAVCRGVHQRELPCDVHDEELADFCPQKKKKEDT